MGFNRWNEQFIVRWVAVVHVISGDKAAFRFVNPAFVSKLRSSGQLSFLDRPGFRIKKADDAIRYNARARDDLFGLVDPLRAIDGNDERNRFGGITRPSVGLYVSVQTFS